MVADSTNKVRQQRLQKLRSTTVGDDAVYRLANGEESRRIYLDSTASTLQLGLVSDVLQRYLPYYANTHSDVHFSARISNREFNWAHKAVLEFVEASDNYGCFFVGSGTTGAINRVARAMSEYRPDRDVVITSIMEHHSNDLPHRKYFKTVVHIPAVLTECGFGCVDLSAMERALKKYGDRVNYVSVTGVSNVTGIVNPIYDIAELAHRYGTLIMVDAAQMAAHLPIRMVDTENPERSLDLLCLSGHKLYAPGSPGVVVSRLDLFSENEPVEVGGGMVEDVYVDRYLTLSSFPDREEAGTPNIPGAIALGSVMHALKMIGMDFIAEEETALVNYAINQLNQLNEVVIYANDDTSICQRAGAFSFHIRGIHHALTAAILNDYFNVAVRNDCFCAHPYVRELVSHDMAQNISFDSLSNEELEQLADEQRGMVRASFGLYNTRADIDFLVKAIDMIIRNRNTYTKNYSQDSSGNFHHNTFQVETEAYYSTADVVARWFNE